jgi:1-hydroxycarotenoid 3,4-desaturase
MARRPHAILVVGAGVGGLAAAAQLAADGHAVTVLERANVAGGKLRQVHVGGGAIDSGPTVLTLRGVFEDLFASCGERLQDHVTLRPLEVLARHAWTDGSRLDLFPDVERTAAAIEAFAGARNAAGYRRFTRYAEGIWRAVEDPFVRSARPSLFGMIAAVAKQGPAAATAIDWHRSMWRSLGGFFTDPRLRQLFARYATYYGSSPFAAPGTLNLIAHVEREGVWRVEGGMRQLAVAVQGLAERRGARFRFEAPVAEILVDGGRASGVRLADGETVHADAVVANVDLWALTDGRMGAAVRDAVRMPSRRQRSLSAITWSAVAPTRGFTPVHHNVCFSPDYPAEFRDLAAGRVPTTPTVYVCAQDRDDDAPRTGAERLLILINAPARGDEHTFTPTEIETCERATFDLLRRCGLEVDLTAGAAVITTPNQFERMFPGTGGALYGRATHGFLVPFQRPTARTRVRGLYVAGGSVHPGAGVPMVAMSGRLAARSVSEDLRSTVPSLVAATSGGTSMA